METSTPFRVDHLLKSELEKRLNINNSTKIKSIIKKVDNNLLKLDEMDAIIEEFDIRSPTTGNKLTKSTEFNLMFQTSVGPFAKHKRYLFVIKGKNLK